MSAFCGDNYIIQATQTPQTRSQFALAGAEPDLYLECVTMRGVEKAAACLDKRGDKPVEIASSDPGSEAPRSHAELRNNELGAR